MPKLTKSDKTERMCLYVTPLVRKLIEDAAKSNKRSITQEINSVLERYYLLQEKERGCL